VDDSEKLDIRAWQQLPKLELFARELRPFWHGAGNEVLHFQHEGFFKERANLCREEQRRT
jgi:N6-adenosine-specific RNA methylase IME4